MNSKSNNSQTCSRAL